MKYGNVKEFRLAHKMTQKQFAEYFEIPLKTVQSWEQGARKPPEYLFKLMVKYLER